MSIVGGSAVITRKFINNVGSEVRSSFWRIGPIG